MACELATRHEVLGVVTLSSHADAVFDSYPFPVVRIRREGSRSRRRIKTVIEIRRLAQKADVLLVAGLHFEALTSGRKRHRTATVARIAGDLVWERARLAGRTALSLDEFQRAPERYTDRLLHRIQGRVIRHADAVITPSLYLHRLVQGWGVPAEKISVVHNACYSKARPRRRPEGAKEFDLLVVGRLVPHKRVDALVRLAARRDWSMEIVGDGPERPFLEALVRSLKPHRIRFRGTVPAKDIPLVMEGARLLVLNSEYEGLSHTVLEALVAGIPVVARDLGGNPEVIRDDVEGRLIPPGDDQGMERAIGELLADPARRNHMGEAGRLRVARDFSLRGTVEGTERVLEEAVRKRRER